MASPATPLSRRAAVARLGAGLAALAAGCTPVRYALRAYPAAFDDDRAIREAVLRAFVRTVAPAADPADPGLIRAFDDRFFPFHKFQNFFAADLCRRAGHRFGETRFDRLDRRDQAEVVRDGLAADSVTRRLYTGAVFLAQLTVFGGIYADSADVPPFGFEGAYRFRGLEAVTYPDAGRFLGTPATLDGNPV